MDHARHRAHRRHPGGVFAAGVLAGLLAGALAVVALTFAVDGLPWPRATGSASAPSAVSGTASGGATGTATERSDRGQGIVARWRVPTARPIATTSPVLLVGDSLAVGITAYVDAGLADRPLTTDAAEGRRTATQVALLEPYAPTSPTTWVVSLGTNDNYEEFPADAAALMALAGPSRCVVWFDVWRPDADEINAALVALADAHPNLHLVPWYDVSAAHPEWFSGTDVHPSSDGYAVRGQLAVDAVNTSCATS